MDLFDYMREQNKETSGPLASRMRPTTLDEVVGQQHIVGKDKLLYRAIKADKLSSIIFYGPPGTGKTTLAKVIAHTTSAEFMQINATSAGKKDMEEVVEQAKNNQGMYQKKTIVLSGKKDVSRKAFAKYIISVFADKKFGKTELYVLDTLAGKWGELEILPQTAYYTTDADSSISIVTEIGQIVEQRYQNYINRRSNLQDESWIVVIVDNNDAILALSSNKNAMATLKDIWGKYSGMKVIFVFTDINNASIPFNAPEIMKIIKERKKYIIFDEISNIKTTDIPLSLTRKYSKPLETGDAYLVEDGDVKKIRTIN